MAANMDSLHQSLTSAMAEQQGKLVQPINAVGNKVDQLSQSLSAIETSMDALTRRLATQDGKLTEILNNVKTLSAAQQPPRHLRLLYRAGLPRRTAGASADVAFQTAYRDFRSGQNQLAMDEFGNFIAHFPTSPKMRPRRSIIWVSFSIAASSTRTRSKLTMRCWNVIPRIPRRAMPCTARPSLSMKLDRKVEAKKEFNAFLDKYSTDDKAAQAKQYLKDLSGPAHPPLNNGKPRTRETDTDETDTPGTAFRRIAGADGRVGGVYADAARQAGSRANESSRAVQSHQIADDLYVIDGGGAGNVAIYITNEGVIMVDDKFEQHFDEIMANVKKVTNQPVKYILSTHYHADHSGGNTRWSSIAEIISTRNAHDGIVQHKQSNAPNNMIPARVTFTQETDLFLGGKEVRAKYYGRGHTNGDAFVYFPALKVLHTGDMFTSATPLIDYPGGGSLLEWTKTLDSAMATRVWISIP